MKKNLTPEQRAARLGFWARVIGFVAIGLIAAPLVGLAIYGLAGIIVAGLIGMAGIVILPIAANWLQNWKLKMIKAEARRSPIETLQLEEMRRQKVLDETKDKIEIFLGKLKKFEDKVAGLIAQFGEKEGRRFDEPLAQMRRLAQLRKDSYREAKEGLEVFRGEIEKAGVIWEVSCAASDTFESAGAMEDEFMARIKTETALDAVSERMNHAFAQLEVSLLDEEETKIQQLGPKTALLLTEAAQEAEPIHFRETKKVAV